jgi:hypothetical protein
LSKAPAGAIAEAFGRFPEWTPAILESSPSLPASVRALASYRLAEEAPVCNLDDPRRLLALGLRPSDVVSRDYAHTRAWARRIYEQGRWVGVQWWSDYDPRWASIGLWDRSKLVLDRVAPPQLDDEAVLQASLIIARRIVR